MSKTSSPIFKSYSDTLGTLNLGINEQEEPHVHNDFPHLPSLSQLLEPLPPQNIKLEINQRFQHSKILMNSTPLMSLQPSVMAKRSEFALKTSSNNTMGAVTRFILFPYKIKA